jgi:Tfp pilus assembly protein PilX
MIIKSSQRQRGFITLVVLVLLLVMVAFAMATRSASIRLRREVKLIERQQLQRLAPPSPPSK